MRRLIRNMTVKHKLIFGFVFIVLPLLLTSYLQFSSVTTLGGIVDKMKRHPLAVTRASALAYANVLGIGVGVRDAINPDNSAQVQRHARAQVSDAIVEARAHLEKVNARILGEEGKALAKVSTTLFEDWVLVTEEVLREGDREGDTYQRFVTQGEDLSARFYDIVAYAENKANGFYKRSTSSLDQSKLRSACLIVFSLVIAVTIASLLLRSILKPLNGLANTIQSIEKHSDLSQRVAYQSTCEVGAISERFDSMMKKIDALVIRGLHSARQIVDANVEFNQQADAVIKSVSTISHEVDEVATVVADINQSIHMVAKNADETKSRAMDANTLTDKGDYLVKTMAQDIDGLSVSAESTTALVSQLQSDTNEIGNIVEVIGGIAEQTNLLALNAAIEAARAGEQGRGFAVVADEVRTLAERTTASTAEIHATIEKLQKGTQGVVDAIRSNSEKIDGSVAKAESVTQEIAQIRCLVDEIFKMNGDMAESTHGQVAASESANTRIQRISNLAKDASADTEKMQKQNAELLVQSQELDRSMQQFKVSTNSVTANPAI